MRERVNLTGRLSKHLGYLRYSGMFLQPERSHTATESLEPLDEPMHALTPLVGRAAPGQILITIARHKPPGFFEEGLDEVVLDVHLLSCRNR